MNVLVTGATGFVGGHLVTRLLAGDHRVTALVRGQSRGAPLVDRGVRIVAGDLHDEASLAAACEGAHTVFHVAGLTRALSEREFARVNVEGTRRLLAAATTTRVDRFVYVSSLAAWGPTAPADLAWNAPPHPVTMYGRSKLAAEQLVRASDTAWTIVRPPVVYGPGDRELLRLFRAARRFGIAPVFGDGSQQLVAIYASDLADALLAAAGDATVGGTYAACHPERFTQRELAHAVGRAAGRRVRPVRVPRALARPILAVIGAAAQLTRRPTLLTTDKANEFLAAAWTAEPGPFSHDTGWRAAHDLRSGLALTAAWYREHGWL